MKLPAGMPDFTTALPHGYICLDRRRTIIWYTGFSEALPHYYAGFDRRHNNPVCRSSSCALPHGRNGFTYPELCTGDLY